MRKDLIENTNAIIEDELLAANKQFRAFASTHEGYAVTLEELEEMKTELIETELTLKEIWKLTKRNASKEEFDQVLEDLNQKATNMVEEAAQTAAMIRKFQQFNGKRV